MKTTIYYPAKIYLSGQITGLETHQAETNFRQAHWQLQNEHGHKNVSITNPLEIKPFLGIKSYWCYMIADIWQLIQCNHIYMLSNWQQSRGAKIEKRIAEIFNINVMYQ